MHVTETVIVEQTHTTHIKCDVCEKQMKYNPGDGETIGILKYTQHPRIWSDKIISMAEYNRIFPHRDLCGDCFKKVWEFVEELKSA